MQIIARNHLKVSWLSPFDLPGSYPLLHTAGGILTVMLWLTAIGTGEQEEANGDYLP